MDALLNIMRWEGFKLRQRRMPWVLLAVLLAFTQLAVWGNYRSYNAVANSGGFVPFPAELAGAQPGRMPGIRCNDLRTRPESVPQGMPPQAVAMLLQQCEGQLANRYNLLGPEGSASTALGVAATIGMVLLAILSASTLGAEYSLGTLRPILLRGVGRQTFLGGKWLALAASTTGALFVATAAAAASGVLISGMAGPPTAATEITGSWGEVAISFVRVWATLLAFLTIVSVLTLLTRSTAAGMALGLGLYLFEGLFVRLMTLAFSWFEQVGDYLPIRNINALARSTYNLAPASMGGNAIGTAQAGIVVAVYVLVAAVIAVVVFRRRDVVGSSGS